MRRPSRSALWNMARKGARASILLVPLMAAGCKTSGLGDLTASINRPADTMPQSEDGLRGYAEAWGKRYAANPDDKEAAIRYVRARCAS